MLYTDLDYRVKTSTKIIQLGIHVKDLGNFIVFIDDDSEDAYLQFALSVENGGERFVEMTARPVMTDPDVDQYNTKMFEISIRACDIIFIEKLAVEEEEDDTNK